MVEDRNTHFMNGVTGGNYNQVSSPVQVKSVLQPYLQSGNGLSQNDRSRQAYNGNLIPSQNGVSSTTYQQRMTLDPEKTLA